jgi:hypothetical protein
MKFEFPEQGTFKIKVPYNKFNEIRPEWASPIQAYGQTDMTKIKGAFRFNAKTLTIYVYTHKRPASWSGGQSFWLLTTRSRVRFPALPWEFFS